MAGVKATVKSHVSYALYSKSSEDTHIGLHEEQAEKLFLKNL